MVLYTRGRRVVQVKPETTRGTFETMSATGGDALPLVREATWETTPIRVERPTLRLTFTRFPDIYPGVARADVTILCEVHGLPANTSGTPGNYTEPMWGDLLRACGFTALVPSNSSLKPVGVTTAMTGGTAGSPLRHGETVTSATGTGTVVGDFFSDTGLSDEVLLVNESVAHTGATGTWTGGTSGRAAAFTLRDAAEIIAYQLLSDVNTMETASIELLEFSGSSSKRLQVKGAMGRCEFVYDHGDAYKMRFTMSGVQQAYDQVAESGYTAINELHNYPDVFLGQDIRISEVASSPKFYGRKGTTTASTRGVLNQLRLDTGGNVVLRENSLDPSGVSFAIITSRAPTGSTNPDEIDTGASGYDFMTKFIAGTPMRLKVFGSLGQAGKAALLSGSVRTGNSVDIICPGAVIESLGDSDRDGVHAWDGRFRLTGGDYDPTLSGEAIGSNNEMTIIYR